MNGPLGCVLLLPLTIALGAMLTLSGCWGEDGAHQRSSGGALVEGRSGSTLAGFLNVKRRNGTIKLFLNVLNAPPGDHAVRLHQNADCAGFGAGAAGALWLPDGGALPEGLALNDLGNLHVDESGRGLLAFSSGAFGFGDGSELDVVGRTVVIHLQPSELLARRDADDTRIGCGVIR